MTRAIDPFEEYLRKKKVEMLENKYRGPKGRGAAAVGAEEESADAEQEERLQEEVQDFFESGQTAAARLFDRVGEGLPEDQVDEIRDALEEVFVETEAEPQAERDGTFVNFFRQVQTSFDEEHAEREREAGDREDGAEVVAPTEPVTDFGDAPPRTRPGRRAETLENGVEFVTRPSRSARAEESIPLPEAPAEEPAAEEPADLGSNEANAALVELFAAANPEDGEAVDASSHEDESDDEARQEAAEAVGVLSGFEEARTDPSDETGEVRIDLLDLLAEKTGDVDELRQRVDLLCRLVARLVEGSDLSQHDLIEMLIKSGVEF